MCLCFVSWIVSLEIYLFRFSQIGSRSSSSFDSLNGLCILCPFETSGKCPDSWSQHINLSSGPWCWSCWTLCKFIQFQCFLRPSDPWMFCSWCLKCLSFLSTPTHQTPAHPYGLSPDALFPRYAGFCCPVSAGSSTSGLFSQLLSISAHLSDWPTRCESFERGGLQSPALYPQLPAWGLAMNRRQAAFVEERQEGCRYKLYNKHIRDSHRDFPCWHTLCSQPSWEQLKSGAVILTPVILKYSMSREQRLLSAWLRGCQHPCSHASALLKLHLSAPAHRPGSYVGSLACCYSRLSWWTPGAATFPGLPSNPTHIFKTPTLHPALCYNMVSSLLRGHWGERSGLEDRV